MLLNYVCMGIKLDSRKIRNNESEGSISNKHVVNLSHKKSWELSFITGSKTT